MEIKEKTMTFVSKKIIFPFLVMMLGMSAPVFSGGKKAVSASPEPDAKPAAVEKAKNKTASSRSSPAEPRPAYNFSKLSIGAGGILTSTGAEFHPTDEYGNAMNLAYAENVFGGLIFLDATYGGFSLGIANANVNYLDIGFFLKYPYALNDNFSLYPVAGLNIQKVLEETGYPLDRVVINAGAGLDWNITGKLYMRAEWRWNPVQLNAGPGSGFAWRDSSVKMALGWRFAGLRSTGDVIANSLGYDKKNSSGAKLEQPKWLKISAVRDEKNGKIFTVKGIGAEYTKLDTAIAELDKLAQRRISEYIDTNIKAKSTDSFREINRNGEISSEATVTSFAEAYTEVKLQGVAMERNYWELATEKGTGPYYTAWGEYYIPNDAIETARKFATDKAFAESYMTQKMADDNNRFDAIREDFSRETEPFFTDASNIELFFESPQKYQARYSHLMEIKTQLESLRSLNGQAEYQSFVLKIKEMVEVYEPTLMLVMSNREQLDRLKQDYESRYIQYETTIARLTERNSMLAMGRDQLDELNREYESMYNDYLINIALLDERNNTLKNEKDEMLALFNNLSGKFERQQNDDLSRIDSYIELISTWQVPSQQQLEELPKEKKYIVRNGDTLVSISRLRYNSGLYYFWVYRCNRDKITNPDVIHVNTELYLPDPPGSLNPAALAQSAKQGTEQ
ncbi:hypothetical protein FACS189461_0880 [Spirochaetia bacterium]|nr:hypothetical protein FACS189461_0880 [Spirochaetia bacterium]